jgi:hypothetical protein
MPLLKKTEADTTTHGCVYDKSDVHRYEDVDFFHFQMFFSVFKGQASVAALYKLRMQINHVRLTVAPSMPAAIRTA